MPASRGPGFRNEMSPADPTKKRLVRIQKESGDYRLITCAAAFAKPATFWAFMDFSLLLTRLRASIRCTHV